MVAGRFGLSGFLLGSNESSRLTMLMAGMVTNDAPEVAGTVTTAVAVTSFSNIATAGCMCCTSQSPLSSKPAFARSVIDLDAARSRFSASRMCSMSGTCKCSSCSYFHGWNNTGTVRPKPALPPSMPPLRRSIRPCSNLNACLRIRPSRNDLPAPHSPKMPTTSGSSPSLPVIASRLSACSMRAHSVFA